MVFFLFCSLIQRRKIATKMNKMLEEKENKKEQEKEKEQEQEQEKEKDFLFPKNESQHLSQSQVGVLVLFFLRRVSGAFFSLFLLLIAFQFLTNFVLIFSAGSFGTFLIVLS